MKQINFDGHDIIPSKVVCIGRNYVAHIQELNNAIPDEPVIFLKPNSAITNEIIVSSNDPIDYEAEIAFIIEAGEIAGVGLGLDLTKRELQSRLKTKGLPWERAKAFDNSAVLSEFVRFTGDINNLRMELHINGLLVQAGSCHLMLTKPGKFLREVKSFMSLENGDVLLSGTPKGVGRVIPGDKFHGKVFDGETLLVNAYWIAR